MAAAEAQGAREAAVIDRHALQRARRGWDIAAALGGFASDRLGFERYEDVDPPWVRHRSLILASRKLHLRMAVSWTVSLLVVTSDGPS